MKQKCNTILYHQTGKYKKSENVNTRENLEQKHFYNGSSVHLSTSQNNNLILSRIAEDVFSALDICTRRETGVRS